LKDILIKRSESYLISESQLVDVKFH